MNATYSPAKEFADSVNAAAPLIEAPEVYSDAWNVIEGSAVKEYYASSPFATITAYKRGFVVENIVTGGKHPVSTWTEATGIRESLVNRYRLISDGCRY
jgi:hypothetical protein